MPALDDWVVLAPTRWKLRKAIKVVNQTLAELKVDKHPDKTTIGASRAASISSVITFHPGG